MEDKYIWVEATKLDEGKLAVFMDSKQAEGDHKKYYGILHKWDKSSRRFYCRHANGNLEPFENCFVQSVNAWIPAVTPNGDSWSSEWVESLSQAMVTWKDTSTPEKATNAATLIDILRYIVNECQKHPDDSVRDIVNEALNNYGMPFYAEWSDNNDQPISILPKN